MKEHSVQSQIAVSETRINERTAVLIRVAGVVGFALATALAAQIRVYPANTPIPITLQTFVVLAAGITLGPWLGVVSMTFYLLLGVAGYQVFATQTMDGWGFGLLIGPSGGYLLGFVLAQPLLGVLTRPRNGTWGLLSGIVVANAIIFSCGLAWLSIWAWTSWSETLALGLTPFLPGLLLKSGLVAIIGFGLQRKLRRWFEST